MITSSNSNNKLLIPLPMSLSNSNNTIKNNEIENSLDFILKHFDQDKLFPRTIMTKKLGYQNEVFSKEEALQFFKESDFIDCRINAFPSYTDYKGIQRYPPDLIFIDIDKKDFKAFIGFEVALSTTLKNIKVKLGEQTIPTVLKTGRGYHIILPIKCAIVLENITEFQKYENDKPSQEFLRFAKDFLSNGKADKNNNPSFKSCLLRVPGSINSKYGTKVKIVQKWNGIRVSIPREFLEEFRTDLIQKKIDENEQRHKMLLKLKRQNNNKNTTININYYEWIDKKILTNPFEDYRKIIVNLILAPYLVVIKKLSFDDSYHIINGWLQKCDLSSVGGRKLDFNARSFVNTALATAYKKQIPPMSITTLKNNYKDLYFLIVQKEGERKK